MDGADSISVLNILKGRTALKFRVDAAELSGALLQSKIVDFGFDVRHHMRVYNPGVQISAVLTYSYI
jgi:hypothetical protein